MPLEMKPTRVRFGKIPPDSPTLYRTVTLKRGDGGPIAPEVEPARQPGLYAQICEIEPGEHYELEISIAPPFSGGRLKDVLYLKTGVEETPEMRLLVTGTVVQ